MNWTEQTIRAIVCDMAAENPLACKALLDISDVVFTNNVSSMAISLEKRPELRINLDFCRKHLMTESEVKCVLLHEFLHVLLLHHLNYVVNTPLLNVALDAVINAIIHRIKGPEYSDFLSRFYEWKMPTLLLRPRPAALSEYRAHGIWYKWIEVHELLYAGRVSAEDLLERLEHDLALSDDKVSGIILIGEHQGTTIQKIPEVIYKALRRRLGDLPSIFEPGKAGEKSTKAMEARKQFQINKWRSQAMEVLRRCVIPDHRGVPGSREETVMVPLLSMEDRRASMRALTSRLMPFARHRLSIPQTDNRCVVYLDVSGSMDNELDQLLSLLAILREHIRMPLYTFSNIVAPARFVNGRIELTTTGGTEIGPVFDHIRKNKFRRALIVTDGHVEQITPAMLTGIDLKKIHVLVSSQGTVDPFHSLNMPYRQLSSLNQQKIK